MPSRRHALLVIPLAYKDEANSDAAAFSGREEDLRTFEAGKLSATGLAPATHYWCGLSCSEETWQALTTTYASRYPLAHIEEYDLGADPGRPDAVLAGMGLKRIVAGA